MSAADGEKETPASAPAFPEPAERREAPAAVTTATAPRASSAKTRPPRRRGLWMLVGGGALVAAALGGWLVLRAVKKNAQAKAAATTEMYEEDYYPNEDEEEAEERAERERERHRAEAPRPAATPAARPAPTSAIGALCNCMASLDEGPVIRMKCVERLRDDESAEAKACLQAYLDDPSTQAQLEDMVSEDPTPEQEVILGADNALRGKARQEKTQRANEGIRAAAANPAINAPTPSDDVPPPDFVSPKQRSAPGGQPVAAPSGGAGATSPPGNTTK